jgi:hypothetical protein
MRIERVRAKPDGADLLLDEIESGGLGERYWTF